MLVDREIKALIALEERKVKALERINENLESVVLALMDLRREKK